MVAAVAAARNATATGRRTGIEAKGQGQGQGQGPCLLQGVGWRGSEQERVRSRLLLPLIGRKVTMPC